jgi:hypothetical protein
MEQPFVAVWEATARLPIILPTAHPPSCLPRLLLLPHACLLLYCISIASPPTPWPCLPPPLVLPDGPDTQATSWAAAGNSRFQSGMTRQRSEVGGRAPSVPPRGGVGMLPPRAGGARRGGGSQMSIMSIGGGAGMCCIVEKGDKCGR